MAKGYDKLYADNIIYSGKLTENPNLMGETQEIEYPIRVREEGKEDDEGYTYFDTEEEAKAELERLASEEFTVNHVDQPLIEHTTKFLDLSLTEEYKDEVKTYLGIGDKVNTIIPQFNLNIETRVVEMVIVNDVIEDITLGNNDIKDLKPPTLNSIKQEITKLPSVEDVIITAKNESFSTVMSGFGGHARHYPDRSIYMDTDDEKTCQYCFILNYAGWFFSKGGVNPRPEDVTMVADINGNFYADIINTGTLNADLIKAGILKSVNGESWINMGTGDAQLTGTVKSQNGDQFVSMDSGGINFQDWRRKEQMLRMGISYFDANRDLNGINFAMPTYSDFIRFSHIAKEDLTNGWTSEDKQYNFFDCWSSDQTIDGNSYKRGINMYAPLWMNNNINIASNDSSSPHNIYNTTEGKLLICGDNGVIIGYRNGTQNLIRLYINESDDSSGCAINAYGNWNFNGGAIKNANIVNTYANTETRTVAEVSTLETNSTDNIRYVYKDITSKDNRIVLNIPSEYQGRDYDVVGVAKLGFGDYRISSKEENRFIIETDREMTMNIEISIN